MPDFEPFVCGHGRTIDTTEPLAECEQDVRDAVKGAMNGKERETVLRWLMTAPLCVTFSTVHEAAETLVGRSVWTHEFARPDNLFTEARTGEHPADLEAHVIGSLDQLMGNKPVQIVRPE